ncbi:putative gustatory receptor 28b [Anopheles ziemanni]|uniref:putative gustatory receptor 28b n=1 Tax=Anopheles coustani TaxID=139045 RepID=UPI00265A2C72|nr:putative gustatory receptor 28b [Anopheles coustani]XP_058174081.1 putative gustatory receptor 28b [Anopheles ziemanni]
MSPLLKYWFNIENFYETIRPCILLLKCFGLLPFSVVSVTRRSLPSIAAPDVSNNLRLLKSEVKFMDAIIFSLWQMFFLQMLYASWPNDVNNYPFSRIITIVSLLLHLISGVFCSVSAVLALLLRQRFIRMVSLVEEADRVFHTFSDEIKHAKIHLVSVVLIASTTFFNILLVIIDAIVGKTIFKYSHDHSTSAQFVFLYYYIIRLIHLLSVTVFIAGVYGFRERLKMLNKRLRKCFLGELENGKPTSEMLEKLQGLLTIYNNLCDGLQIFCLIFVWQPMFLCATVIMSAVFTILAICNVLANSVLILKALAIIYSATTILFMLHFLLVIQLSNDLKKEGKLTAVLVHKAINQSWKTPAAVERLLLFSQYLQHQTPVVSCGLFSFDWTLVLSIISALATYSIIMIQFELGVPKFFISVILQIHAERNVTVP